MARYRNHGIEDIAAHLPAGKHPRGVGAHNLPSGMIGGDSHPDVVLIQRRRGVGDNGVQRLVVIAGANPRKRVGDAFGDWRQFRIQHADPFSARQLTMLAEAFAQRLVEQVYDGR